MSTLQKQVLALHPDPTYPGTKAVCFNNKSETRFFTNIYIPVGNFEDMGRPEVITVTIHPGDRLNTAEGVVSL